MVRLVPLENDIIPMVLLVDMYLIKGTKKVIFSCGVSGYRAIPMDHWYQRYDWQPLENDVIPMVLLVNMHLIKGT